MSDNEEFPGVDEGQSVPEKGSDQENKQPATPQYLTMDQVEALLEKRDAQLMGRFQQSSRDRQKVIQSELEGIKTMLTASNVKVTPEMETTFRKQIEDKLDAPKEPEQKPGQSDQAGDPAQFIYNETMVIFRDEGLNVTENDPEWKIIRAALDDPQGNITKYRREVLKAVETKRTRLTDTEDNADVRVNAGGGGRRPGPKDISNINDSSELYDMGEAEIKKGQKRR